MSAENDHVTEAVLFLYARACDLSDSDDNTALSDQAAQLITSALLRQGLSETAATAALGDIARASASARSQIAAGSAAALSATGYDAARAAWLCEHGMSARAGERVWPPTSQTVRALLGAQYWNDATAAVGLPASTRGRQRGNTRFSAADYSTAIADFLTQSPGATAFTDYVNWAKDETIAGRPRPSGAAVRKQYGSWSAAKDAQS